MRDCVTPCGRPLRWLVVVLGAMLMLCAQGAQSSQAGQVAAGAGVSRALALDRAGRVSDVRYALTLDLHAGAATMGGQEVLQFRLRPSAGARDLLLDFRDGTLSAATLNGTPVPATQERGHLRLPAALLHAGMNEVTLRFASRIATAGAAITRYQDKDDGSEYLYSLFVPMDASMAFPCFDQPDLKARFTATVHAPRTWTVVSNTQAPAPALDSDQVTWRFPETRPISTYLFAFAAGPWARMPGGAGQPDVYVRRSQQKRAALEVPQLQAITGAGMRWLTDYFAQPFPFPKYDLVLIPGFPFGGMEHAGATFLREDGVLFRTAPTATDRFQRNILTLHELTHQWFGDLVTMRWFDDLWLKEGFAQYMAYRAMEALEPSSQPWQHFYEEIKPQAYGIDETEGTTPIFQDIPNLKDAKSAYGAIVYQKAPSILKQLDFRLGPEPFRKGLQIYLRDHAYGNAQWKDLITALRGASGQDVQGWADAWVLRRGMPEVSAQWSCDAGGRLTHLTLYQEDVLADRFVWPMSNEVLLGAAAGAGSKLRVDWATATAEVPAAVGRPCPHFVFANAEDQAYGRFPLDARSEASVRARLVPGPDQQSASAAAATKLRPEPLLRSMLWGALWENVHTARSSPSSYVGLVLANLPSEADETQARVQGAHATTALHAYLAPAVRAQLVPPFEAVTREQMLNGSTAGLRIVSFRTLAGVTETGAGRATLKQLLGGELRVPGVELRPLDRWNLVGRLLALNDAQAAGLLNAEQQRDSSGDGQKYAWAVQAARPDAATKAAYFAEYTLPPRDPAAKPEDWLTQSLGFFNAWNESELTAPFLQPALLQLPEIKRDRKIFFLGAWLGSFLGGQVSPASADVVRKWLAEPGADPDLRRKVLENADALERTIRIRQRYP